MKVYIDGEALLEVLGARGVRSSRPGRNTLRQDMLRWLSRYAEIQQCDVTVVFGAGRSGEVRSPVEQHGKVRVVNLQPGAEVLHEIAGPASRAARLGRVWAVASDAGIEKALNRGRARAMQPEEFMLRAQALMRREPGDDGEPQGKFSGVSEGDVEFWTRFFEEA